MYMYSASQQPEKSYPATRNINDTAVIIISDLQHHRKPSVKKKERKHTSMESIFIMSILYSTKYNKIQSQNMMGAGTNFSSV